ncbi:hypothetical protein CDAR_615431 [Caerostris darwini]|uniref:Uncharacterized protein n=1 Tax=Caerostris darwini TaxID=1538125 RepID=A0AAV4RW68_9ARAC|nr:hypothetical protein CDAR_615431 [Caerostris darwini]
MKNFEITKLFTKKKELLHKKDGVSKGGTQKRRAYLEVEERHPGRDDLGGEEDDADDHQQLRVDRAHQDELLGPAKIKHPSLKQEGQCINDYLFKGN